MINLGILASVVAYMVVGGFMAALSMAVTKESFWEVPTHLFAALLWPLVLPAMAGCYIARAAVHKISAPKVPEARLLP